MGVEKTGDYTFLVPPAGLPGEYDVDVFGRGPGGDVITTFAWATSAAGFLPEPDGYLGIVSGTGGDLHAYPPELGLNDLAETPRKASAVITVTAANGKSLTMPALAPEPGCYSAGQLFFRGTDSLGSQVLDLGPKPYRYSVEVTLDGATYTGTGVFPDDETKGSEPYVDLDWEPPLPAYTG